MSSLTKGSCLCGAVTYQFGSAKLFQYCHCSRCRKVSGSAHSANLYVAPEQFQWLGGEAQVGYYALPTAKYFATAFCKTCGSALPWLSRTGKVVVVPGGSLDGHPGITPSHSIFCASRAAWYVSVGELPQHDELPPK